MDGKELVKQTLDQIPQANANAKRIVGLVKEGGRITGYQLSDNSIVKKQQAVGMAKQGQIAGVGIAHRGNTEYLKSIPDGSENNNLAIFPLFLLMPKDNNLPSAFPGTLTAVSLFIAVIFRRPPFLIVDVYSHRTPSLCGKYHCVHLPINWV